MKKLILCFLCGLIITAAAAQDKQYVLDKKISIQGDSRYVSVDNVNKRFYISNGTAVNVIDQATQKLIGTLKGGMQSISGVAIDNKANRVFIADDKGMRAIVFDLKTLAKVGSIPLSLKAVDDMIYNPFSDKVFAIDDSARVASLIDPNSLKQVGTFDYDGPNKFTVSDGTGKVYKVWGDTTISAVVNGETLSTIWLYSTNTMGGPKGTTVDRTNGRILKVCHQIAQMYVEDGHGKPIPGVNLKLGVDAIIYDAETKLILVTNPHEATIIKQVSADDYKVIQTIKQQSTIKALALNDKTHEIYLSVADVEKGTDKVIRGTFTVLVYKLQ